MPEQKAKRAVRQRWPVVNGKSVVLLFGLSIIGIPIEPKETVP